MNSYVNRIKSFDWGLIVFILCIVISAMGWNVIFPASILYIACFPIWKLYSLKRVIETEGIITEFHKIETHDVSKNLEDDYDPYQNFELTIRVTLQDGTAQVFSEKTELDKIPVVGERIKLQLIDGAYEIYRADRYLEVYGSVIVSLVMIAFLVFMCLWKAGYFNDYF